MDQRNGQQGQQSIVSLKYFLDKKEIIGQDPEQPNITSRLALQGIGSTYFQRLLPTEIILYFYGIMLILCKGIGKNREYNFHWCVTSSSPTQANTA